MSQQAHHYEEEFRDGPPEASYQAGYSGPEAAGYPPPSSRSYAPMPGKIQLSPQSTSQAPSPGARLALAIVSMGFVFITFMVTLMIMAGLAYTDVSHFVSALAVFFAIFFAIIVIVLNVLFNRKH